MAFASFPYTLITPATFSSPLAMNWFLKLPPTFSLRSEIAVLRLEASWTRRAAFCEYTVTAKTVLATKHWNKAGMGKEITVISLALTETLIQWKDWNTYYLLTAKRPRKLSKPNKLFALIWFVISSFHPHSMHFSWTYSPDPVLDIVWKPKLHAPNYHFTIFSTTRNPLLIVQSDK